MRGTTFLLLATASVLLLVGCPQNSLYDFDGDGIPDSEDCAPEDPNVYPTAPDEEGNGVDENCDGVDGELVCDADGDGYVNELCGGNDCDDNDADVNSSKEEICDGKDTDCDGDLPLGEVDLDMDGAAVCEGDCDDSSVLFNILDEDGDGYTTCDLLADCDDHDELLTPADLDFDGYSTCTGDCDDFAGLVHPLADELCDGLDTDCDGEVPAQETDGDGDGHAACADCDDEDDSAWGWDEDGDGFDPCEGDCDETSTSAYPGAFDAWGDGDDLNCDGVDGTDADGDGYPGDAEAGLPTWDCDDGDASLNRLDLDADGVDTCGGDCDDGDGSRWPGNWDDPPDDGHDSNCDGLDWFSLGGSAASWLGEPSTGTNGSDIWSIGDPNGDGFADFLVGGSGSIPASRVVFGSPSLSGTASLAANGAVFWDIAGDCAAGLEDLNGDGLHEVAVSRADQLFIFSGSGVFPGSVLHESDALASVDASANWGAQVALLGDLDADSLPEVLVGAPNDDTAENNAGVALLFSGSTVGAGGALGAADSEAAFLGTEDGHKAGRGVTSMPDLDGDGLTEVVIGATNGIEMSEVHIVLSQGALAWDEPDLTGADITISAPGSCCIGITMAGLEDIDGDGLGELGLGRYGSEVDDPGRVYVFLGSTLMSGISLDVSAADVVITGSTAAGGDFGWRIDTGDVDGDGLSDLAAGDYDAAEPGGGAGVAYLFLGTSLAAAALGSGSVLADEADYRFIGEHPLDLAGSQVVLADVDGDGLDDLVVSAPSNDDAGPAAGKVYLLPSPW